MSTAAGAGRAEDDGGMTVEQRQTDLDALVAEARDALTAGSEVRLTGWMLEHLALRVWTPPSPETVLADVERRVIAALNPPLNMTQAGPRPRLREARAAMAKAAVSQGEQ
ncbi:hypothetical protein [Micrococcus sp.]|uniref:hypothetical protein n=1 Tax=Micrococcus sp. TaxID=1271 RepID=UPI002A90C3AF|nr:hypothetical protein [Micrococcus sp.]MDY6054533.1 hypothetical protein [Micrococcus sp.]